MAGNQRGDMLRQLQKVFSTGVAGDASDDRLIRRFITDRDESAFEALVERHGPMVLSVCRGVLRNPEDAQDAFQATFLILARKAGSVRAVDSLGSWLYRVAYNMAIQINADAARRRKMERRAAESARGSGREEVPGADRIPELYEEIHHLPERFRLPIVLCHLEDLTHAQAAERLGWTVGTVRGRVARARAVLRGRLLRRGIALTPVAVASALTERAALGGVPPSLVWTTVEAAKAIAAGHVVAAGSVSTALLLSERGVRAMTLMKLKTIAAFAAAAGTLTGAACLVAFALGQTPGIGGPGPVPARDGGPATGKAAPVGQPSPATADPAAVPLAGRVLDPDGRPVEGASIRVLYNAPGGTGPNESRGKTGAGGRFEVRVPRDAFGSPEGPPEVPPSIQATAKGFGPAFVPAVPSPEGQAISLVKDDLSIEGRVLDLSGRPVEGATVRSTRLYQSPGGDLTAWLKAAQTRGSRGPWAELAGLPFEASATTGPDGRFRLAGLGRERVAELTISGPRIASARLYAMTRGGQDVSVADRSSGRATPVVYHAARFDHAAAPSRPIVGTVRDADDGRPLASARVVGIVPKWEDDTDHNGGPATTTDGEGRYRLDGLPAAAGYRVFVFPGAGQPYPNVNKKATADPLDTRAATCDVVVKRGILVRGRLTDKETGRPVTGRVFTFSFRDNPAVQDYPGFAGSDPPTAATGPDGRFEVVALPGRGLIVAGSNDRKHFQGAGAAAIEGLVKDPSGASLGTFQTLPHSCPASAFQAYAEINPDPRAGSVTRDLQFDPGHPLKGTVVDADGRPVTGTIAGGLSRGPLWEDAPRASADFEVVGVQPGHPRRVYFFHPGRKLAGSILVDGTEAGPVVVRLKPWGVIAGRIVTDDDRPRSRLILVGNYRPQNPAPDYGMFPKDVPVDADGRFRIEGLVPGLQYEGRVGDRPRIIGSAFKAVRVEPGETKDLGDLKPSL